MAVLNNNAAALATPALHAAGELQFVPYPVLALSSDAAIVSDGGGSGTAPTPKTTGQLWPRGDHS